MDGQGLYLSIFISYRKFLGDESSKQVASILTDKDSECVKCFWPLSVGPWATFQTTIVKFSMKKCYSFDHSWIYIYLWHNLLVSPQFYMILRYDLQKSCLKMLLKHRYLKFGYVDIVLMVSKMFRGNLTADMLAIGVTVVLISEIDTNCRTISAWIWYILSMSWYKKICNATNGRLPGDEIQKGIWEALQLWCVVKSAHLQSVSLCMFLSSNSGKTYLFKLCTDTFLVKPVCLI